MTLVRLPWPDRLWTLLNKQGPVPADHPELGPCWIWSGSTNQQGYGRITVPGNSDRTYVHRTVYELLVGPIPDGLTLDHLCHTVDASCLGGPTCLHRRCANPAHLEPVPLLQNALRGNLGINHSAQTHCVHGHAFTGENVYPYKGRRICRECVNQRSRQSKARRREALRAASLVGEEVAR